MSDEYCKIVEKATEQLQYDILCLGDEEILALSRIIHAYVVSKDQSSNKNAESLTKGEPDAK